MAEFPNLNISFQAILDHIGTSVLVFDDQDNLVLDNRAARHILGTNLVLIRAEGWSAFAMIMDSNRDGETSAAEIRDTAVRDGKTVRFGVLLAGTYTPCTMSVLKGDNGQQYIHVTIDAPDWSAMTELMQTFRDEAQGAVNDTRGHADFLRKLLQNPPKNTDAKGLGERAMGMVDLISAKMYRLDLLIDALHRLEIIRVGELDQILTTQRQSINITDFFEDFIEELYQDPILGPQSNPTDEIERLQLDIDDGLRISAPKKHFRTILRDMLRNAFLYSASPSPIKLRVSSASQGRHVELSIIDQGCGVRARDNSNIYNAFWRSHQPQVMREHGYGLSLHLAKAEIDAMGGRVWFTSEEGVGSTFSFKLPAET